MWKQMICVILCFAHPLSSYAKQIREISVDDRKIVKINTALGYSTILEFSSKPLSAVLGDQDAFKIEFVKNSITIKPLLPNAKSNLFIFTEYDRFNCTVETRGVAQVDYLVRFLPLQKSDQTESLLSNDHTAVTMPILNKVKLNKSASRDGFSLKLLSIGKIHSATSRRSVTIVDFEVFSRRISYAFSPSSFGIKQKGKFVEIESIYLDSLELHPKQNPIHGKIALADDDFKSKLPFTLVFATPKHRIEVNSIHSGRKINEKGK